MGTLTLCNWTNCLKVSQQIEIYYLFPIEITSTPTQAENSLSTRSSFDLSSYKVMRYPKYLVHLLACILLKDLNKA